MLDKTEFYIDGKWEKPQIQNQAKLVNPATEQPYATVSMGTKEDVDRAVIAARQAFQFWKQTTRKQRLDLLNNLLKIYKRRYNEMAQTISTEMGAPITMARQEHAQSGLSHLQDFIETLETFEFEQPLKPHLENQQIIYQPIGICGLITPWNWPINQLALKVIPALAVGCTVVLKPSEIAPLSAMLLAEMIDEAGYPAGVFNLVNGDGLNVGNAISGHEDIDMVSFTGSTNAGIAVMKSAATTVKKVTLELGGKSPNIIFADADVESAVASGTNNCFGNSGQTCVAPTRLLVERSIYDQAVTIAKSVTESVSIDSPEKQGDHIGPLSSQDQFTKVQEMIQKGIDEGATLVAGGLGKPEGMTKGYYVKPTVFANVNNQMAIAKEEIFGPVLSIIPFDTEEQAIDIANDTPYGLNARLSTGDKQRAKRVARQLDAGMIQINGVSPAAGTPFGGMKKSGIGREGGRFGLEDYLEVKAVSGWTN